MKQLYKTGDKAQKMQGDISLLEVSAKFVKPLTFKPLPKNGFTVAIGETSGNRHVVVADRESIVEMAEDENGVFIRVLKGSASLTGHREHEPYVKEMSPLEGKVFYVGRMFEFDELSEIRKVQD